VIGSRCRYTMQFPRRGFTAFRAILSSALLAYLPDTEEDPISLSAAPITGIRVSAAYSC